MNARANRREVKRWMLSASLWSLVAAKPSAGATVFNGQASQVNFDPVRTEAANLAIGNSRAEEITEMRSEGTALTGLSTGKIDAPDAVRTGAKTLQIELLQSDNRLLGRAFAIAGHPNLKNVRLPFVFTLSRS